MANFTSIGRYEAVTRIPAFLGLQQQGDGIDLDPRYAVDLANMNTPGGVLQPFAQCELLPAELPAKIETLAVLHRRWYQGAEGPDVLIAASAGQLYWMLPGGTAWTLLPNPKTTYARNTWSWVSYEINPEGAASPVDVLVLSNQVDGMVYVRCDDVEKSVTIVATPKLFGVIERYNERIWGGDILDDPDMVVYSAPYDFTDWTANAEYPEDGAGDIQQPTWDGDSFTALRQLGSQLIAFRRNTVWRILGTDPGEWVWRQQYGGGTAWQNTVCVEGERVLMLGEKGLLIYDGLAVRPFLQQYGEKFFARMTKSALEQAVACVWKGRYYLSVPVCGASANNAVLIYDIQEGTWLLRDDISVEAWLPTDTALYFTSSSAPGKISAWGEDAWPDIQLIPPARWTSGWFEMTKDARKGGWTFYFTLEAKGTETLQLSIETEKKRKDKLYLFGLSTGEPRQKRIAFGGAGRRFRLHIESAGDVPWRIIGGLQLNTEIDRD